MVWKVPLPWGFDGGGGSCEVGLGLLWEAFILHIMDSAVTPSIPSAFWLWCSGTITAFVGEQGGKNPSLQMGFCH